MDLHRLQAFRSVVATGSVRAAAQTLGYSPAAISQQVTRLQRDTGITLLTKAGRGLEPTPTGLALAERIDAFLADAAELEDFIGALRTGQGAVYTLRYFSSLGAAWLPRILTTLTREFPEVHLELRISDELDPLELPRADLQFVVARPGVLPPDGYRTHPEARDPYVVALPAGHPLAAEAGPVPLAALRGEPWVDINRAQGGCRQIVLDACAAAGYQPRHRVQSHDYPMALAFVAAGLGVTVLPGLGSRPTPAGVVLRPVVDPTPVREVVALVARHADHLPITHRLLELTDVAAQGDDHPDTARS